MKTNYLLLAALCCLSSCKSKLEPTYEKIPHQLLSEELLTRIPGSLIVTSQHLVWEDPFSRDFFVHVHDNITGDTVGSMGVVDEGPEQFITGGISSACIDNRFFASDANGNTKGYLSLDSLIQKKNTFKFFLLNY